MEEVAPAMDEVLEVVARGSCSLRRKNGGNFAGEEGVGTPLWHGAKEESCQRDRDVAITGVERTIHRGEATSARRRARITLKSHFPHWTCSAPGYSSTMPTAACRCRCARRRLAELLKGILKRPPRQASCNTRAQMHITSKLGR
jgi:hypothetical protein